MGGEKLQRNGAFELGVLGLVDNPRPVRVHAPTAGPSGADGWWSEQAAGVSVECQDSHSIITIKHHREPASELLPRVHLAISLLKRWLLGTHQGAVSHEHLDYYLDEFVFRFNRRSSRSRGKLFFECQDSHSLW